MIGGNSLYVSETSGVKDSNEGEVLVILEAL